MASLDATRIRYLGRKAELPNLLRDVAQLPMAQRSAIGRVANEARHALELVIERRSRQLAAQELERRLGRERVDVTLPADPCPG